MVSVLRQTRSELSASYVLERNGAAICTAEMPFRLLNPSLQILRGGGVWASLETSAGESIRRTDPDGRWRGSPFFVRDGAGRSIGRLCQRRVGSFLSRYQYTELSLYRTVLRIYEVGLGREGMKYPVYDGERQLALIEKPPVVYDNLDEYFICGFDEFGEFASLLFSLYLDVLSYRNAGEYVVRKKEMRYVWTRRKELLEKCDPAFRSRCGGGSR